MEMTELEKVIKAKKPDISANNSFGKYKHIEYCFDNGYGASLISNPDSCGGNDGLIELAVIKGDKICYDSPITDDVIGWLNAEEALELISKIEALPKDAK